MKRWHRFMTALLSAILLALPMTTAEAFWGWGGFGFSFGGGFYGSGWHRHHWYRPWYRHYYHPYRWRRYGYHPWYRFARLYQPVLVQPAVTETTTSAEK